VGFSNSAHCLQPPNFASGGAILPKVSGHMPNYSQFWETEAGDWVRSSLRGGAGIKAKRSFTFYTSTKAISNERTGYPTGRSFVTILARRE